MKLQRVIPTLTLAAACAIGTTSVASAATTSTDVPSASSENWSGYVAGGSAHNNPNEKFKSVTGSFTVPTAKAGTSSEATYSAFWVGLGGTGETDHLEQDGVEVNTNAAGKASYYAWYELVPKAPVKVDLAVSPGDKITATTTVDGTQVTETIDNDTTGQSFSKTLTMSDPDTSSAEWIAEAPSECASVSADECSALPLTDFGTVDFSSATATNAGGHTGSISDSSWTDESVSLNSASSDPGFMTYDAAGAGSSGAATPSSLSSDGSSFSVSYSADSSGESGSDGYGSASGAGDGYGYGSSTGGYGGAGDGYGYGSSTGGYGGDGYGYGGDGYGYGSATGGYGGYGYGYGSSDGYGVLYQTSNGSWVYVA